MRIALIPGSFDPITLGHVNIIERAARIFDKVYVAVMFNDSSKYASGLSSKKYMFSIDERLNFAKLSLAHLENVEAIASDGMLIDLYDELGADAIVKGIRNGRDLEYELIHAKWNREHNERAETLFIPAEESLGEVSSTLVRDRIDSGRIDSLEGLLSPDVINYIKKGIC